MICGVIIASISLFDNFGKTVIHFSILRIQNTYFFFYNVTFPCKIGYLPTKNIGRLSIWKFKNGPGNIR